MRFGVLGPLAVWTDRGGVVTIPGRKVRALLADLLVHEGRPVSADRLVDDLWGEAAPADPAAALHVRVSQLRRALAGAEAGGRELVASQAPGYALRAGSEAVDSAQFGALVGQAQAADDPRSRADLLAEALHLWRGPTLADFADDEFAQAAVARWEEQRLAAVEAYADARLDLGQHRELASELGEQVTHHPYRERLRAAHMRALHRAGRTNEALDSFRDMRHRLADELGLDPSAELTALHQAILAGDPVENAPAPAPHPLKPTTNLPAPVTALLGRDHAMQQTRELLETSRLVTLTGPGGVGKTSVATAVARALVHTYPDGAWLVDLTTWDGQDDAAELVLSVLSIPDAPVGSEPAAQRLAAALREQRMLLVLDNCEHVVASVAELVGTLLRAAPGLRVLTTSREPLRLRGEARWDLLPLDIPDSDDAARLEGSPAVRLFLARAGLDATPETVTTVAEVCRRLDGLPLALELAATRVPALGVSELAARLTVPQDRFGLLGSGPRDAPARQQSLAAVIDWSWQLLTEAERAMLSGLAVHSGGCALTAVAATCAEDRHTDTEALDLLAGLVDRSLVVRGDGGRFRLLESVSAYCLDRLREAGQEAVLRHRHAEYYLALAEQADPQLRGPGQREWLRMLDAEAANLRVALDTFRRAGAAEPALRLAVALVWYRFLRGRLAEAQRALTEALALSGEPSVVLRVRAEAWHAALEIHQGQAGPERIAEVLPEYDGVDDDPTMRARARWFLATSVIDFGDQSVTAPLLEQALDTFRAVGDRWGEAAALSTRAMLAHMQEDPTSLERDARRSAELFRELGDAWGLLQATDWLIGLADMNGDQQEAERLTCDGLRIAQELGLWSDVAGRLGWLAWISVQTGDYARAHEHAEQAQRLAAEYGQRSVEVLATIGLAFAARRAGNLDLAGKHMQWLLASAREQQTGTSHPPYLAMVLIEMGLLAEQQAEPAAALAWHREGFDVYLADGSRRGMAWALAGMAAALVREGPTDVAAQLLGAADAARADAEQSLSVSEAAELARITAAVEAAGPDVTAWSARGHELTLEQARSLLDRA